MKRFVVTYSYPSWDRYYRPQCTTAVDAVSEKEARFQIQSNVYDARILRIKECTP